MSDETGRKRRYVTMACPDCGSKRAVDKATAWDAAASTPPKVQNELDATHTLRQVARNVVQHGLHYDSQEVWEGAVLHEEAASEIERLRAEIAADAAAIQAARQEGYCSTCGQDVG